MELNKGETKIVDELTKGTALSVIQIAESTELSVSNTRTLVKRLEIKGCIKRVDDRMPYVYKLNTESVYATTKQRVQDYRRLFLGKEDIDNDVVMFVKKWPKQHWATIAIEMEYAAEAISQLNSENMLFDTL